MGFVLSLIFLLGVTVGYWLGRSSGYSDGFDQGKKDGKKAGIDEGKVEGIKDYLRKELLESKAMSKTYEVDAATKARDALEADIKPKPKPSAPDEINWLALTATVLIIAWVWFTLHQ
ncbi:MAG: hypothetical protein PHE17_13630 [Thiothrix sp.]|uniref:hypothetical protein n=1 Tax=Thiothrix sp. TaxID=1032 RepID=UPI0026295459|nr:hypothetical protein [Thiothrix sp.]MDD5394055.1 hypothetical protein [Thiothrix sp.]